jgi:hypothetical protein
MNGIFVPDFDKQYKVPFTMTETSDRSSIEVKLDTSEYGAKLAVTFGLDTFAGKMEYRNGLLPHFYVTPAEFEVFKKNVINTGSHWFVAPNPSHPHESSGFLDKMHNLLGALKTPPSNSTGGD